MTAKDKVTLGVLICDRVAPELRGIGGDYPDMFDRLFREHSPDNGTEVDLRFYDVTAGVYPGDLSECAGYLTSGSAASVNDPEPWVARFEEFTRRLHSGGTKLFAICFGHQMVAKALGGQVEVAEQGWGVGVHRVTVARREGWMVPAAGCFDLISSHREQVTQPPPGAVVLGTAPHCPVAMFRCGSLLGVQGHPEFAPAYARALMESRASIIPAATRQVAAATFSRPPDHALLVSWITGYLRG